MYSQNSDQVSEKNSKGFQGDVKFKILKCNAASIVAIVNEFYFMNCQKGVSEAYFKLRAQKI